MTGKNLRVLDPLDTGMVAGVPRNMALQNTTNKKVDEKGDTPPKSVVGVDDENPLESIYFTS